MIGLTTGLAALTLSQEPPGPTAPDSLSTQEGRSSAVQASAAGAADAPTTERVLCVHCGRTASNGLTCQGICVADSGY